MSTFDLNANLVYHAQTKYVELDLYIFRDRVIVGNILVNHLFSTKYPIDILTTPLFIAQFIFHRGKLTSSKCP